MNLVQIQENLKDLPIQAIMGYANGKNPEVPPYMALSELNRRKSMEQRATQQPTQSVKDKIESQVSQPQAPQGQQAPQGPPMPQGPLGIAQLPGAQPPAPMQQGIPSVQAAPQQAAPTGMANGGLAGLPVPDEMFNYAPGGIVAFAGGNIVYDENGKIIPDEDNSGGSSGSAYGEGSAGDAQAAEAMTQATKPAPVSAGVNLQSLVPRAAARLEKGLNGEVNLPAVQSKEDIRKSMIANALAEGDLDRAKMLSQIPGAALVPLMEDLKKQNEESKAQFKDSQGRMGLAGLSNALIAAGEATRGHKGMAFGEALGGFGKSYNASSAEEIKRQQAQTATERQQSIEMATLKSKLDDLRSAHANGTVEDQQITQKAALEQAYKLEQLGLGSAKDILAQALAQSQADVVKSHYADQARQGEAQLAANKEHYAQQASARTAEAANRAAQLKALQDTRQDAIDQRARGKLDDALARHPAFAIIRDKLKDPMNPIAIGSEEYTKAMDEVERIRRLIMKEHPEFDIPDTSGTPQYAKDKKTGSVIVSYDNWETSKPVNRALTGGR